MIIQPFEVVRYSTARSEYDTKWITPILDSQEFFFFKTYISVDAYNCFMTHLIPLGVVLEWNSGTAYLAGQKVYYEGVIYNKIADGGSSTLVPFNNPQYDEPNRFNDTFLQTLWTNSLRSILAEFIMNASLIDSTYQVSSRGVIATRDDNTGMAGVTKSEMSLKKDGNDSKIYAMVEFMKNYITLNATSIPCLPWRNCECGVNESPVQNKTYGGRSWHFLSDKY